MGAWATSPSTQDPSRCPSQFFEFLGGIAQAAGNAAAVRLSPASIQPISSDDVATFMHDVALAAPVNGVVEIAGPDRLRLSDLVEQFLRIKRDPRTVIADPGARYFGALLDDNTLVPAADARIGPSRIAAWLPRQAPA